MTHNDYRDLAHAFCNMAPSAAQGVAWMGQLLAWLRGSPSTLRCSAWSQTNLPGPTGIPATSAEAARFTLRGCVPIARCQSSHSTRVRAP